jgi:hypothetical protein
MASLRHQRQRPHKDRKIRRTPGHWGSQGFASYVGNGTLRQGKEDSRVYLEGQRSRRVEMERLWLGIAEQMVPVRITSRRCVRCNQAVHWQFGADGLVEHCYSCVLSYHVSSTNFNNYTPANWLVLKGSHVAAATEPYAR